MSSALPVYLSVTQTIEHLGLRRSVICRRIRRGELPCLQFTPRIWRVEAQAVLPGAPHPLPPGPRVYSVSQLAALFSLPPEKVYHLIYRKILPCEHRGGRWVATRFALYRFILDNTVEGRREP